MEAAFSGNVMGDYCKRNRVDFRDMQRLREFIASTILFERNPNQ
jgi:hypothetical protein